VARASRLRRERHAGGTPALRRNWRHGRVFSLREEHALMSILGSNPGDQWLIFYEGEPFDKRVVTTKNGAEAVLFFNVGIPMKHQQKKISEAKKNPKK
jgi:hypothetical protein